VLLNLRLVLRDLGLALHVPGLMALATLPVCLLSGERSALEPFLFVSVLSLVLGQGLFRSFKGAGDSRLGEGMVVAALAWFLIPWLGAIPFWSLAQALQGTEAGTPTVLAFLDPWNAIFESYSGFTGTGLTMAARPSELPASLQWWRSFTEWIGGVGVIVLMLSILRPGKGTFRLYFSEAREEKIFPSVRATVRTIWWIFLLYSAGAVLLLKAAGLDWWTALNHGMTGLATGGFGITDDSFAGESPSVKIAAIVTMVLGAVSFANLFDLTRHGNLKALVRDAQHRLLWILLLGGSLVLGLENLWHHGEGQWLDSAFQWSSALSTAGFQSVDLETWSATGKLLLSFAMILGGAAGSTAGGLKLIRVAWLKAGILWKFRKAAKSPHEILHFEFDGERIPEDEADQRLGSMSVMVIAGIGVLWLSIMVMEHFLPKGFDLADLILEMASTQGNVGLSTGITGPHLAWQAKAVMCLVMWVGRLEVLPVLMLFALPMLGRRKT